MVEMEIGAWYRTRDGRKTGKLENNNFANRDKYPFMAKVKKLGNIPYHANGRYSDDHINHGYDLIEKLPPKVKKPAPTPDITESAAVALLSQLETVATLLQSIEEEIPMLRDLASDMKDAKREPALLGREAALLAAVRRRVGNWNTIQDPNKGAYDYMMDITVLLHDFTPIPSEAEATLERYESALKQISELGQLAATLAPAMAARALGLIPASQPDTPAPADSLEKNADTLQKDTHAPAEPELLPCAFCGGEATIFHNYHNGVAVKCKKCKAIITQKPNKQEAITAWNTRAQPQRVPNDKRVGKIVNAAVGLASELQCSQSDEEADALTAKFRTYLQSVLPPEAARGEVVGWVNVYWGMRPNKHIGELFGSEGLAKRLGEGEKSYIATASITIPATPTGEPR